jgi:hypothetical protein
MTIPLQMLAVIVCGIPAATLIAAVARYIWRLR